MTVNLIYIGERFYAGTILYDENGFRSGFDDIRRALRDGEEVSIRQATRAEIEKFEAKLAALS